MDDFKTKFKEFITQHSKMENLLNKDREYIESFHFITRNSNDFKIEIIKIAETIDRTQAVKKIAERIKDNIIANEIEKGVFEFALVHTTINDLEYNLVKYVYDNKLIEIYENLNETYNTTLLPAILKGDIKPVYVAFLEPVQLNPKAWSLELEKQRIHDEIEKNTSSTNIYKCYRCGNSKCRVRHIQTRSADEPMTTFVTCLVCFNTFKD